MTNDFPKNISLFMGKFFNALYPFISYLLTDNWVGIAINGTRIPFVAENLLYVSVNMVPQTLIIELLNFKNKLYVYDHV